jgi:hypothetical protein
MLEKIELLLQQKIHNHSSSKILSLEILLSLHSYLMLKYFVPCAFITDYTNGEDLEKELFFISSKNLLIRNKNNIKKLNINITDLISLPLNKRKRLYVLVEEVILNCYGEGEIYYDCSRMSPFCENNIINYIASKEIEIDPNLRKILIDRQNKKEIFKKKFDSQPKEYKWNSVSDLALFEKLNELWQGLWDSEEIYKLYSYEDKMIDALILKKSEL